MKNDINTRNDVAALVNAFYEKVKVSSIGHFFSDVVKVDWEKHLPKMYDFWEGIVFGESGYSGNPINAHTHVHSMHAFSKADFEVWIQLFHRTVDEMYKGEKAELIKQRATSIATVMQLKVIHNNQFYS